MSEHMSPIPSMIYNAAVGGHVTNSQQIIDENLNREQNDINQETVGAVPYNSITPNGMGRIVLKKNDNFKQVIEAQTDGNTIFIIKYDFTLTGDVIVPANCVLEFEGGSISGAYTLTCNNTKINDGKFSKDIIFAGTYDVEVVYVDWFIYNISSDVDETANIQNAVNLAILANASLSFGSYGYNSKNKYFISTGAIDITGLRQIEGNNARIITTGTTNGCIFIRNNNHVPTIIKDLSFIKAGSTQTTDAAIIFDGDSANVSCIVENCYFEDFSKGIVMYSAFGYKIVNNTFRNVSIGISSSTHNYASANCVIQNNYIIASNLCIYLNRTDDKLLEGYIISGNILYGEDTGFGIYMNSACNIVITNNIIDHCLYGIICYEAIDWNTISNNYIGAKNTGIQFAGITSCKMSVISKNKLYNVGDAIYGINICDAKNIDSNITACIIKENLIEKFSIGINLSRSTVSNLQLISNVFIDVNTSYNVHYTATITNINKMLNIGLPDN